MKQIEKIPPLAMKENPFQEHRREELLKFWESGCRYAELDTQGTVTMSRERALYKQAMSSERLPWEQLKLHQRGDKLFIERRIPKL